MMDAQALLDVLKAGGQVVQQANLLSTATDEERRATLERWFTWWNNQAVPAIEAAEVLPGKYAVVDFETGGVNPATCAIVGAACILLDENLEQVQFPTPSGEWVFGYCRPVIKDHPQYEITQEALNINGVSADDIENGAPVDEVLERLRQMVKGHTVVAYNAKFDVAILNHRLGLNIQTAIDPMRLAYRRWPHPQRNRLAVVAQRLGIEVVNAHDALGDVLMTMQILRAFADDNPDAIQPEQIGWNWKPWDGG